MSRGDAVTSFYAVVGSTIGAGTAAVSTVSHGWLQLEALGQSSDGLRLRCLHHDHVTAAHNDVYTRTCTVGRCVVHVTREAVLEILSPADSAVDKVVMKRMVFEWSTSELDVLIAEGFADELTFMPKRRQWAGQAASRLSEESGDEQPDWSSAFRPQKRPRSSPVEAEAGERRQSPRRAPFLPALLFDVEPSTSAPDVEAWVGDEELVDDGELERALESVMDAHSDDCRREGSGASSRNSSSSSSTSSSSSSSSASRPRSRSPSSTSSAAPLSRLRAAPKRSTARVREESAEPWTKIVFFGYDGEMLGWIVYDEVQAQLDAQCFHHRGGRGGKCHVHRVLRKRPIGYLSAWLLSGCARDTRDEHFGKRLARRAGEPCSFENRVAARAHARAQPQLSRFFQLEAAHPPGLGDTDEPRTL